MHNSFCPRRHFAVFVSCWLAGLILGILAAVQADVCVVSLMRPVFFRRVSIVLLLLYCALPLLIAAWAVMIQKLEILFFLVFCRCFAFGFFLWLQVRFFGSAAWLAVSLSRISDQLSLIVFCGFVLDTLCCAKLRRNFLWISLFITSFVVVVDFLAVSPFLGMLSDY